MSRRDILVFTEEPSAMEIVRALARSLSLHERVHVLKHDGLAELLKSVGSKIGAEPFADTRFLILRDADSGDCHKMKSQLLALVPENKRARTKICIACQELEAWYIAQPEALANAGALAKALPKALTRKNPDFLQNPKEIFRRYARELGQIEIARKIGPRLDVGNLRSTSFGHFVQALRQLSALP